MFFLFAFFAPFVLPWMPNISNFFSFTQQQQLYVVGTEEPLFVLEIFIYCWGIVSSVCISYYLISYFYIRKIWIWKQKEAPHQIKHIFEDIKKRHGSYDHVQIKVTCEDIEPGVVGCFFPVIVIPQNIVISFRLHELELLLLHELSHVKRWDSFFIFFQRLCESLYFFHPLIWLLSFELNRNREICCDMDVVNETTKSKEYATVILKTIETKTKFRKNTKFSLGYFSFAKQRLRNIMKNTTFHSCSRLWYVFIVAFFVFCLSLWGNVWPDSRFKKRKPSQLHISSRESADSLRIGRKVVYTIETHNKGITDCTDLEVKNKISSNVKLVKVVADCDYYVKNNEIIFSAIALKPKQRAIYSITVQAMQLGYSQTETTIKYNEFDKEITVAKKIRISKKSK